MEKKVKFIGASCGQHGPYTFYKAFKYKKNGVNRIVTLGEFFFVKLWIDSDLLCIGELQLLWIDKNSEQVLASLRLYFLPENTPEGRMDHGEDEVLAIAEKVVLRVEDLVTWITVDAEWTWGRLGRCGKQVKEPPDGENEEVGPVSLSESSLDFTDVDKEKLVLENEEGDFGPSVVILSYPKYCRYRAMMRRLEGVEDEYLKHTIVKALGGFSCCGKNTRVMFCRDTFEYPDLEGHELLCNHLAPKLKGRPRGKRKKRSVSPGSESNESECSVITTFTAKSKASTCPSNAKNGFCLESSAPRRSTRSSDNSDTKEFLKKLTSFMKLKRTPLGRTPCLGSKEIDLHDFYTKVQKMGGYDLVTSNRQWKNVSDDMSGQQNSGTATVVKRHYERFLLPYERHVRGEEYKPLPVSERRRLKSKSANNATRSETDSPPSASVEKPPKPPSPQDSKETNGNVKQEPKVSSLRSVRVKPERQKDKFAKVVKMEEITTDKDGLENIKVENGSAIEVTRVTKEEDKRDENEASVKIEEATEEKPPTVSIIKREVSPFVENQEGEIEDGKKGLLVLNVPCNPSDENDQKVPSLENIKQELTEKNSLNTTFIDELRKEKLDILKEGGLEVTPVCSLVPKDDTKDLFTPKKETPSPVERLPINIPQSLNISKVTIQQGTNNKSVTIFPYPEKTDSTTPPKVVQSRSIYSYSEKTVYGNPKDCLVNSYTVHTPKAPVNLMKPTGGDLLDLTVASPQKPMFDTRVPSVPSTATSSFNFNTPRKVVKAANLPIFEGRKLGSNLEITLVDSKQKVQVSREPETTRLRKNDYSLYKVPNKPTSTENKVRKGEENGDHVKPSTSSNNNNRGKRHREETETNQMVNKRPNNNNTQGKTVAEAASNPKYFPQGVQFPHYLSQFYEGNKGVSPYFPMIDPLLYSAALQSLYPQTSSPLLQFTSQEQLKLYTELMAQQSRVSFPFRLPTDEEFPNNNKK
ncbi:AT-rich interactive domain-containing protein 5B-like isoform X2 [Coccinella septempunctata]|uniref:AT-rich interactive domain-containing protein 5B-like isoform X2 n=1 Tax=Coccinella septempunctata TaxID=41139 RepID=UPI001D072A87|nr:AT-rich interactive domain-containing protein 5B-like isoform X2 [Coccinella septempunctata]